MGGLDAGIKALRDSAKAVERLTRVPSRAAAPVAQAIAKLVDQEFATQSDANGEAWEAHQPSTVQRWGKHAILDLTGAMRGSIEVKPMSGAGVSITIDAPQAAFHQIGTKRMVARPILPSGNIPETWKAALEQAVNDAATQEYGGGK